MTTRQPTNRTEPVSPASPASPVDRTSSAGRASRANPDVTARPNTLAEALPPATWDDFTAWAEEPVKTRPRVSVVIPAYNEAERIIPTIGAIASHMSARKESWELLIADDGSSDTTVQDVQALGLPNVRVLIAEKNGGKGKAVRRGMMAARGDLVLFADADQSTPIEFVDDLIASIEAGHDVAIGSRAADGSLEQSKSITRRVMSGGLRTLVRVLFNVGVKDTQCGFKLFTAEAADDLFRRQRIDGFSFDLEVLYLAAKRGWSIEEVPVEWFDAPGSTVDAARVAVDFLKDLVRIRIDDARGAYDTKRPRRGYQPAASSVAADTHDERST